MRFYFVGRSIVVYGRWLRETSTGKYIDLNLSNNLVSLVTAKMRE